MLTQRHDLIFVDSKASFEFQSCYSDKETLHQLIVAWFKKGLPCIYARQLCDDEGQVNLGLSLRTHDKKYRVGLVIAESSLLKQALLPKLVEMAEFFFHYYGVEGLVACLDRYKGFSISVYGSFLFHYLSGQAYVDDSSDLDLLIDYPGCSLSVLNELIDVLHKKFNRTIDGEVRFMHLGDVATKELLDPSAKKLLFKKRDRVELLSRTVLYECYPLLCVN